MKNKNGERAYLTLIELTNGATLLGYLPYFGAQEIFNRAGTHTHVRLLFAQRLAPGDMFCTGDSDLSDDAIRLTQQSNMNEEGWAYAPEIVINAAQITLARNIPNVDVPYRTTDNGTRYILKVGGEND